MEVPVYQQQVGLEAPGSADLKIQDTTPAASGVNVAEAASKFGLEASHLGSELVRNIIYSDKIAAQMKSNEIEAEGQDQLQKLYRDVDDKGNITGYGTHKGRQASGQDIMDFRAAATKVINDSVKDLPPGVAVQTSKRLSHHATAVERAIANNVVEQTDVANHDAAQALVQANSNSYALDPKPHDGTDPIKTYITPAANKISEYFTGKGEDKDTISNRVAMVYDHAAETMVHANIETKPDVAKEALEKIKPFMSADKFGDLMSRVDAKYTDMRTEHLTDQVLSDGKLRNTSNQEIDRGGAEDLVKQAVSVEHISPGERRTITDRVVAAVNRYNGDLREKKQDGLGQALDIAVANKSKSVAFTDTEKQITGKFGGLFSPSEMQGVLGHAAKAYEHDPEAQKLRLSVMSDDQKWGYAAAVNMIHANLKNKSAVIPGEPEKAKLADVLIKQLDSTAPNLKSGLDIKKWTEEQLKSVPTKDAWVTIPAFGHALSIGDRTMPGFKAQARLESTYGPANFRKAMSDLQSAGEPFNYVDIENKLKGGAGK